MSKASATKATLNVEPIIKRRLDKLARLAGRSSSTIAADAISEYLDLNEAQIAGIKQAIELLDRGEFVPHERVREWVLSWGTANELPKPRPAVI